MKVDKSLELRELSKPLIKWLNENFNPHCMIVITSTSTELLFSESHDVIDEFVPD